MLPSPKKYTPSFSNVPNHVIGQYFTLPANTPFWSICLQQTVSSFDDLCIKITNTCMHDNTVFAIIQNKYCTIIDLTTSYEDKTNGEISIDFHKLIAL